MNPGTVIVARGRSDRDERLLSADEPLAALQRACGGALPGIVAIPQLLELVRKFGVDGKNKNPSRLSRLPGARRTIGAVGDGVQRLVYLNPQPEQRRILE